MAQEMRKPLPLEPQASDHFAAYRRAEATQRLLEKTVIANDADGRRLAFAPIARLQIFDNLIKAFSRLMGPVLLVAVLIILAKAIF